MSRRRLRPADKSLLKLNVYGTSTGTILAVNRIPAAGDRQPAGYAATLTLATPPGQ
jgi:hypothetical protein